MRTDEGTGARQDFIGLGPAPYCWLHITALCRSCKDIFEPRGAVFHPPIAAGRGDTTETVAEIVLVAVVADSAQIVVTTLGAFPSDTEDRLLSTRVAHRTFMFDP